MSFASVGYWREEGLQHNEHKLMYILFQSVECLQYIEYSFTILHFVRQIRFGISGIGS